MSRGIPVGILLALSIATCAGGYSFLDLGIGGPVYTGSARGSAMGDVGWLSEENAFSTMLNPATLGMISRPDVSVAYQYCFLHETRAFPAYDSFDALLGYNVYATNKEYHQDINLAFATGVMPRALGLSFGVMYTPVFDLNYAYEEEIRDRSTSSQPADELLARAYVQSEGTLKAVSFAVGRALAEDASLGVGLDYVFGSYDVVARIDRAGAEPDTRDEYSASKQSGVRWRFAGRIKAGMRLEAGFEATTRCAMKGDFEANTANGLMWYLPLPETDEGGMTMEGVETVYPTSLGVGIRFRPRNVLTTVFEVGMEYTAWSDYRSDFYGDFYMDDVYTWHAGVEHVFYSGMPLRFGLMYTPSPREDEVSRAAFTFGTGLTGYGWNVDFSGQVGWQKYRYPDLFDDQLFGMPSRQPGLSWRDEVSETSLSGRLSFTRRF